MLIILLVYKELNILFEVRSSDLLTYIALLLAYVAYCWSVRQGYDSWKSLFISFRHDLNSQKNWFSTEYSDHSYSDKNSYSPMKIIYPLSFESLHEIIKRGIGELRGVSTEFTECLSIFNERILAFNSILDHMKLIASANPQQTEELIDFLNELGLHNDNIDFENFKKKIFETKKEKNILYLAENCRRLNKILHIEVIGDRNSKSGLNHLYTRIINELTQVIDHFDSNIPPLIRYKWQIILVSIVIFMAIEVVLV